MKLLKQYTSEFFFFKSVLWQMSRLVVFALAELPGSISNGLQYLLSIVLIIDKAELHENFFFFVNARFGGCLYRVAHKKRSGILPTIDGCNNWYQRMR